MSERTFPMKAVDIEYILKIEQASFPSPWSRRSFLAEVGNPYSLSIVIKMQDSLENGGILAYSCNHIIDDEVNILRMAVSPEKRRLGLASCLLDTVLLISRQKGATKAYLEVRPSNVPARSLYRDKGFQVIASRPGYYAETGEEALIMMKRLEEM